MKKKTVTEDDIIAAMEEMTDAGIPVKSFEPRDDGGADFVFKKMLTPQQQKEAKQIAAKYIKTEWSFV